MKRRCEINEEEFKPCEWFADKVRSGMRIGDTRYSLQKWQGAVHIYDATEKNYRLLVIVDNLDEANEWLKQKWKEWLENER